MASLKTIQDVVEFKCCFIPIALVDFDLLIRRASVQCRVHYRLSQAVDVFGNESQGYRSGMVTAFSFQHSTPKRSEPSFSIACTIGAAHSVLAVSIAFLATIRFFSAAVYFLAVGPTRYGVE